MDAILFELVDGGGIAIDAEEISALWSGKEPGTTAIERMGRDEVVVVIGEYDIITATIFDHVDFRPKKKVRNKITRGSNDVLVDLGIKDTKRKKKVP